MRRATERPEKRGISIVVVEDDEMTLAWMYNEFKRAFRFAKVETYGTEAALREAMDKFQEDPPALIIMDVMLRWSDLPTALPCPSTPYEAGLRCHAALQRNKTTRAVPIIFYTAVPAEVEKRLPKRGQHVVIVSKAQSPEYLIAAARSLVSVSTKLERSGVKLPEVSSPGGRVFVILPFGEKLKDSYAAIRRGVMKTGRRLKLARSGEQPGAYSVTDQIETSIATAELVICDLSDERPNVYYELGYARALGKNLICVAKTGTKPHFDIAHVRIIFYDTYLDLEDHIRKEVIGLV